ncbi:hypothetical protein [Planktotalea sp.]|uniref:hypothetical protein n=1 Tax=Planktotalea sp. TaxID=2029877 RepID=UPI003296B186
MKKTFRILIMLVLSLVFGIGLPQQSNAEGLYWDQKTKCFFDVCNPGKRYRATSAISLRTTPGFLANAQGETAYGLSGVYFPKNTRFAVFEGLAMVGGDGEVLVLSETGNWAFVLPADLQFDASLDFSTLDSDVFAADRWVVSLQANGVFRQKFDACSASLERQSSGKVGVKVGAKLGVSESELSLELASSQTLSFPKGYNILIHRFARARPSSILEVRAYQECGTADLNEDDFRFDVFLDGSAKKLRPETFKRRTFEMDRGKPVITCSGDFESYAEYLREFHDIPEVWLPVVGAMTARWPEKFLSVECH